MSHPLLIFILYHFLYALYHMLILYLLISFVILLSHMLMHLCHLYIISCVISPYYISPHYTCQLPVYCSMFLSPYYISCLCAYSFDIHCFCMIRVHKINVNVSQNPIVIRMKSNRKVRRSWVPNTFPRMYLSIWT